MLLRVAESIRRWKRLTVYTRAQMQEVLVGKLIATSAEQIGMFLVILACGQRRRLWPSSSTP